MSDIEDEEEQEKPIVHTSFFSFLSEGSNGKPPKRPKYEGDRILEIEQIEDKYLILTESLSTKEQTTFEFSTEEYFKRFICGKKKEEQLCVGDLILWNLKRLYDIPSEHQ